MTQLRTKIFADGADLAALAKLCANPAIKGFTTNPTLMRKAGISDYEAFARSALELVGDRPISFEVFSDDLGEMEKQGRTLASWGSNVYVKIPVTNTKREPTDELVRSLSQAGVRVNVTNGPSFFWQSACCRASCTRMEGFIQPTLPTIFCPIMASGIRPISVWRCPQA